jgi:hypothetical protein
VIYGRDFWCIDANTGERLPAPVWPDLQAFRYPDGSRGFWVLRNYTVEFVFRGIGPELFVCIVWNRDCRRCNDRFLCA